MFYGRQKKIHENLYRSKSRKFHRTHWAGLDILDIDQSYCVPGRFISDATCYVNQENIPLAIVSLDQEKAFDRIHHDYLFKTLDSFRKTS
jgi:hypothetical protein